MRPTVLLFDVDGTLVTTGGAGRRAIVRAFAELHGRSDACDHFHFGGMTDLAILRAGLVRLGLASESPEADSSGDGAGGGTTGLPTDAGGEARDETTGRLRALLARYLVVLAEEIDRTSPADYRVHRGMRAAVDAALAEGLAVGLGTGNVEAGARLKLRRVALDTSFAFGGYGDDSEARAGLLLRGAERGASRLGVPLSEARIVVIGDTPKDVAAAHAIGAESVAVATGGFSLEVLAACRPTRAFVDLTAPGALAFLLQGR